VFLTIFREVIGLFKGSGSKGAGKVCPNGHVMQPSWDICPYCQQMQESMMRQGGGGGGGSDIPMPPGGGGTVMVNVGGGGAGGGNRGSSDKSREVCGWLVALNGTHKGEDFRLRVGKNVIGTAADCDIVLSDKKLSRKHATIRYEGGEFQIADLDSSNGTHVNDEKVQKHDLIDNDIIKLGDIEFEFKCRAMRAQRD
jgi:Inner membrane component of T3SS, cytoplasmic domain